MDEDSALDSPDAKGTNETKDAGDKKEGPVEYRCICPWIGQETRRKLGSPAAFVVLYSAYLLMFVCIDMYFYPMITTIEKRFGFSSSQSGILIGLKEVNALRCYGWG